MNTLLIALITLMMFVPLRDPPTFPPQLHYYDAQVKVLTPHLEEFQAEYHSTTGRYYQALVSHSTPPDVPTPPDHLSGKPSDQDEDLAYFWTPKAHLPDVLAWALTIDTYNGPSGEGYVLTVITVTDGATWQRSVNFGPETWREQDWQEVIQPEF